MKALGAFLIVLGLIGILWGGFTYTTQKKIIDLGPVEATHDKTHTIPVSPIAGAVALIAGIACMAGEKRT